MLLDSDAMLMGRYTYFVINPVIVGSGTTLFRPGKRTNLRLVSVTERRNGVVTVSYANA